jgi:hypothetical protein
MSTLYTLAYPEISAHDPIFINAFRNEYALLYRDVVSAHFTMVFGGGDISETEYLRHIETVAAAWSPIPFSCQHAMLGADHQDDTAYVFLVPNEGYSTISLLHDHLYMGILEPFLKLEVPFIPHITIGTMKDRKVAKELCGELNRKRTRVDGHLRALTVGALENGRINNLASFQLGT